MKYYVILVLLVAACTPTIVEETSPITIRNQGGEMEGHTPRGFAGEDQAYLWETILTLIFPTAMAYNYS